mmetsp:Transcript_27650/g.80820  ORF Transcript_27650/g.80820 Transcript_27650/m.80820 type:complete len:204 (-) Transcript_27650:224-835(-)
MISWMKRKGGRPRCFSLIFGLEIREPMSSWVMAMSPVHCSMNSSKFLPSADPEGPITSMPPDLGAMSSLCCRCPPLEAGGLSAASGGGRTSAFSSAGAPPFLSSPPFAPSSLASLPPAAGAPPRAILTASADVSAEHAVAALASAWRRRFVFSASCPASVLVVLMLTWVPWKASTHATMRSRYSCLSALSVIERAAAKTSLSS